MEQSDVLFPRAGVKLLSCGARNLQYERLGVWAGYYLWARLQLIGVLLACGGA